MKQESEQSRRVPLFGSWRQAYLAVGVIFIVELGFFYFVSRAFL